MLRGKKKKKSTGPAEVSTTPQSKRDDKRETPKSSHRTRQRNRTPSTASSNGRKSGGGGGGGSGTPQSSGGGRRQVYSNYIALEDIPMTPNLVLGKYRALTTTRRGGYVTPVKTHDSLFVPEASQGDGDVKVEGEKNKNRCFDGDWVYVQLGSQGDEQEHSLANMIKGVSLEDEFAEGSDVDMSEVNVELDVSNGRLPEKTWNELPKQQSLWSPQVEITAPAPRAPMSAEQQAAPQRQGKVVHVIRSCDAFKVIGIVKDSEKNGLQFHPVSNKYPLFYIPPSHAGKVSVGKLYSGVCEPSTWGQNNYFPAIKDLKFLGDTADIEGETIAALLEHDITWTEQFPMSVEDDVQKAVSDGRDGADWEPTQRMLEGRRDFRESCIFTIDPTTARDLDDALGIEELADGSGVRVSVHIADVSHFVKPGSETDVEAQNRCTTVYMVDRVIPMLPRPLCEVACSLNEGVQRLAFSLEFDMNYDGTLKVDESGRRRVWYGKSVIKSCCRLDYKTAQNIIEGIAGGNDKAQDDVNWDPSRRPIGKSMDDVVRRVRLMHRVAMNRRKLRYDNGAVGLHCVKLAFKMKKDEQNKVPDLAEPYPIKDSNRVVEEFMLLANYLVAEKLIVDGKGGGVLRRHPRPLEKGLSEVVELAGAAGVDIDASTSEALQRTLNEFTKRCNEGGGVEDDLKLQAITALLTSPMQPAVYFAAGEIEKEEWCHFALNIPYYTHFTSPIRRYADVLVHRMLENCIKGEAAVDDYLDEVLTIESVGILTERCNERKMGAKKAQERSDRVFLALYLKDNPIESMMGIVIGIGEKSFTVLCPGMGVESRVYCDDHRELFDFDARGGDSEGKEQKMIHVVPKEEEIIKKGLDWRLLQIKLFAKVEVSMKWKPEPPIDVKIWLVGPWKGGGE